MAAAVSAAAANVAGVTAAGGVAGVTAAVPVVVTVVVGATTIAAAAAAGTQPVRHRGFGRMEGGWAERAVRSRYGDRGGGYGDRDGGGGGGRQGGGWGGEERAPEAPPPSRQESGGTFVPPPKWQPSLRVLAMSEKMVSDVRTRLNLLIETDEGAEAAPGPIESFDDMVRPRALCCPALPTTPGCSPLAGRVWRASFTAPPTRRARVIHPSGREISAWRGSPGRVAC
jgi:hypothetical protein